MKINRSASLSVIMLCLVTTHSYAEKPQHKQDVTKSYNLEPQICSLEDNGQSWNVLNSELQQQLKSFTAEKGRVKSLSSKNSQLAKTAAESIDLTEGSDAIPGRYYVPVVVHVYGEQFNCENADNDCLTDDKIQDALRTTSQDFNGLNPEDGPIAEQFQAIRDHLNIEFVLAKKDPDGNPTNGIVRYNREQKGYGKLYNNDKIAADSWDNYKYMNVYIMLDINDNGASNNSGIAWYPDVAMSDQGIARVVYNGRYIGGNTNENFRSVLSHEFGHWLHLPHTFNEYSCSIESEAFCALTGDHSCDTPQVTGSDLQNNAKNCLGQATNTENFMHYTDNYAMYTQDQVRRMTDALHGDARRTLWANENLISTGLDNYVSNAPHEWEGFGIDDDIDANVLLNVDNISAAHREIDTYAVDFPVDTEAAMFYLDRFDADPDLFLSIGKAPEYTNNDDFISDYRSWRGYGSPEGITLLNPVSDQTYYNSVFAYSAYNNARLRVLTAQDPFLCDNCRRISLRNEVNLSSKGGDKAKEYNFKIPKAAERVVVVMENGFSGDPDLSIGVDKMASLDLTQEVSTDTACVSTSGAGLTEYCEFNRGGRFNIKVIPTDMYSGTSLKVYYEINKAANFDPTAVIASKNMAFVDRATTFSSEGSHDSDGNIVSYAWNFGNQGSSEEEIATHIFATTGEYTVTLTVTDNQGDIDTISQVVNVVEMLAGDWNLDNQVDSDDMKGLMGAIRAGQSIDSAFDLNNDGTIDRWDVREVQKLCSYYRCATQASAPVAIANGDYITSIDQPITLSSEGSTDSDGEIVEYRWDFGDNYISFDANPSHTYTKFGEYSVSLTVTDSQGHTSTDVAQVSVGLKSATNLADTCADQPAFTGGRLTPGTPVCLPQSDEQIRFSFSGISGHSSLAITMAYGEGDGTLVYKNDVWPTADNNPAISENVGNQECIFIDNLAAIENLSTWGLIHVNGNINGASIVVDFDTDACRN